MYLTIDIGNTLQKIGVFEPTGRLVEIRKYRRITPCRLRQLFNQYTITNAILCAVGKYDPTLEKLIQEQCSLLILSAATPLPITLRYDTPQTLGPDRIANAVGASKRFPHQNILSVQLGSCIVCDFVNDKNEYLGGSIAPGIKMRLKALQHYTRKLPLVKQKSIDYVIGKSTEQSILSGVINGIAYEIEGFANYYAQKYPDLKVVLTGGDAEDLQKSINFPIFATQNLVTLGLYEILHFYVEK